ncbi:MAG: methyltransferase domain-containing protein [Desulforegulaceae bacterium]|nr:methyltransferase domain-containing protein [Desulforegulaceae bacterium]
MFKKKFDFNSKTYRSADFPNLSREIQLFFSLLNPIPGDSILSIGSNSHEILKACLEINLDLTLTDPEKSKLQIAQREFSHKISYHQSEAEDLPFDDNSFEYSFFFNSLGNTKDPVKALEESFRVTKNYVFIGVTNRFAIKGVQKTIKGFLFPESHKLKLFSIFEIKQIIKNLLGDVPVKWRTVSTFDLIGSPVLEYLGYPELFQKSPFGNFAGICVCLQPRFRLKPLELKVENPAIKPVNAIPQRCAQWKRNYTKK